MAEPRRDEGGVATAVMGALDLAIDIAYHDGTPRDLAVADEAYALAGYYGPTDVLSHAHPDEAKQRIANARYGKNRRLLRSEGRGMLRALTALAESGVISYETCSEAKRQRWLTRGGHERAA